MKRPEIFGQCKPSYEVSLVLRQEGLCGQSFGWKAPKSGGQVDAVATCALPAWHEEDHKGWRHDHDADPFEKPLTWPLDMMDKLKRKVHALEAERDGFIEELHIVRATALDTQNERVNK